MLLLFFLLEIIELGNSSAFFPPRGIDFGIHGIVSIKGTQTRYLHGVPSIFASIIAHCLPLEMIKPTVAFSVHFFFFFLY